MERPPREGPGGDLGAEAAGAALLHAGGWGSGGGGMPGKGHWLAREVRNMLPEDWAQGQVLITMAWECRAVPASSEAEWGPVGVGEVREMER